MDDCHCQSWPQTPRPGVGHTYSSRSNTRSVTAHEVRPCVMRTMRPVMNDKICIWVLPRNGKIGVRFKFPLHPYQRPITPPFTS